MTPKQISKEFEATCIKAAIKALKKLDKMPPSAKTYDASGGIGSMLDNYIKTPKELNRLLDSIEQKYLLRP